MGRGGVRWGWGGVGHAGVGLRAEFGGDGVE